LKKRILTNLPQQKPQREELEQAAQFTRLEKNVDQLPIWAPSQYANEKERTYHLPWRNNASVSVQSSGKYGQLRWFDKLVLTALVQIWNSKGRNTDGWVYFQIIDIIDVMSRSNDGRLYDQIKASLNRLRGSLIQFSQSFYDKNDDEWQSHSNATILSDLWIIEPKKRGDAVQGAFQEFTRAQLDFAIVRNLLGHFTRPVSLAFLQTLSERGGLFEAYISSVLYRRQRHEKDVFRIWRDLGLSTKGIIYGSKLAHKMKRDLDRMCDDSNGILERYEFRKSKENPQSQILCIYRREKAFVDLIHEAKELPKPSRGELPANTTQVRNTFDKEAVIAIVHEIEARLGEESANKKNLISIAMLMPKNEIDMGIHCARAAKVDGRTRGTATGYFVGVMKQRAKEIGIKLPFER